MNLSECDYDAVSSSYRYRLPHDVVLDTNCGYLFSLLDISLSLEIVNNKNCDITFRNIGTQETITRRLHPYCCTTGTDLVATCNAVFAQQDVMQFCHSEVPPFGMQMQGKGNDPNRVKLASSIEEGNIQLELNDFLSRKLGFIENVFGHFPVRSTTDPNINYGNEHLLVLFDCCQNRIYNNKLIPLVDTVCLYESARKETAHELPYAYSTRSTRTDTVTIMYLLRQCYIT